MTKGEVIDLILLSVNGGKLSDDANVQRGEIAAYMNIAFATAAKAMVVGDRALAMRQQPYLAGAGFSALYKPYIATPVKDESRGLHVVDLPDTASSSDMDGVGVIYPIKNPSAPYIRMLTAIGHAGMPALAAFPSFHVEDGKVFFHNLALPVGQLVINHMPGVVGLGDDDAIPYSDEVIGLAIQAAESWFRRQRETRADDVSDDKDLNEK